MTRPSNSKKSFVVINEQIGDSSEFVINKDSTKSIKNKKHESFKYTQQVQNIDHPYAQLSSHNKSLYDWSNVFPINAVCYFDIFDKLFKNRDHEPKAARN